MNPNEKNEMERIVSLVEDVLTEEDFERQLEIVDELLEIDPGNPIGVYIRWQFMDDDESDSNIGMLEEAASAMESAVKAVTGEGDEDLDELIASVYSSMLSDLASHYYFKGDKERALSTAREFMRVDRDCYLIGRMAYYACLIEAGDEKSFAEAIDAADSDVCETPISAHVRAIALFETEGAGEEASDALLEAVSMDPDLVFYILGLWTLDDLPDDEMDEIDEDTEDFLLHVGVLSDLWSATEERLAFISIVVFAFAYMTDRLDSEEEVKMLEEAYEKIGYLEEMLEARDVIRASVASGNEQEETDDEALMIFRDMREKIFPTDG